MEKPEHKLFGQPNISSHQSSISIFTCKVWIWPGRIISRWQLIHAEYLKPHWLLLKHYFLSFLFLTHCWIPYGFLLEIPKIGLPLPERWFNIQRFKTRTSQSTSQFHTNPTKFYWCYIIVWRGTAGLAIFPRDANVRRELEPSPDCWARIFSTITSFFKTHRAGVDFQELP